ncbi:uL15 family ribosomal protein [Candidatus Woesearchaeota archaeon]|nr:uL15 family ribosomal protein [Candidatus Woesearchaeota archaeon]
MTINKRKKCDRARGKTTHGWGAKKKHRGAGNRGGRGMAGTGKRAKHMKTHILKKIGISYYGKHGFNRPQSTFVKLKQINLEEIDRKAKKQGTEYIFDASGYKVLAKGNITKKIKITADAFSQVAKEKIEAAGGEAILC